MHKERDKVLLSREVKRWPIELAEALLANPLPFADQSDVFFELASCVDGAYERHGDEAWEWVNNILTSEKDGAFSTEYSTQDLFDIIFLHIRIERFNDGFIQANELLLRSIVQEVVKRVYSDTPPNFVTQISETES